MAPSWLYGGYVFQVLVKQEILTLWVKFDFEGQGKSPPPPPTIPPEPVQNIGQQMSGPDSSNG